MICRDGGVRAATPASTAELEWVAPGVSAWRWSPRREARGCCILENEALLQDIFTQ